MRRTGSVNQAQARSVEALIPVINGGPAYREAYDGYDHPDDCEILQNC